MKRNIRSPCDLGIDIFIGLDVEDELYKAIAEDVRKELYKEIFAKPEFIEIIYSELV